MVIEAVRPGETLSLKVNELYPESNLRDYIGTDVPTLTEDVLKTHGVKIILPNKLAFVPLLDATDLKPLVGNIPTPLIQDPLDAMVAYLNYRAIYLPGKNQTTQRRWRDLMVKRYGRQDFETIFEERNALRINKITGVDGNIQWLARLLRQNQQTDLEEAVYTSHLNISEAIYGSIEPVKKKWYEQSQTEKLTAVGKIQAEIVKTLILLAGSTGVTRYIWQLVYPHDKMFKFH